MKKVLFVAAFAVIGLASAFASVNRATFFYVQTAVNSWELITTTPDPARCLVDTPEACSYVSPVSFGATATKTQLTTAGAVPSAAHKIYVK